MVEPQWCLDDLKLVNAEQAWHYRIIPQRENGGVRCYTDRQKDLPQVKEELELLLGVAVELANLETTTLTRLLSKHFFQENDRVASAGQYTSMATDFLTDMIREARRLKSSDIHLEVYEDRCRVRIRIDGLMIERYHLPKNEYPAIINKIKIQAGLDISEKRLPQDGRINFADTPYKIGRASCRERVCQYV